jgi:D-proline reductase (dithiol) PrdB
MPAVDRDERFERWLRLTREMHANTHFTANAVTAWAPMSKPLAACRVALVTTAGAHLKSQPPHDLLDHAGDPSFRVIPGDTATTDLAVDHVHYDTTDANADPNCVLPLDRLRELAAQGVVGSVAPHHLGFMGFIPDGRTLRDSTAPLAAEMMVADAVDAVVLTPG